MRSRFQKLPNAAAPQFRSFFQMHLTFVRIATIRMTGQSAPFTDYWAAGPQEFLT
jgi:hypothetical protein